MDRLDLPRNILPPYRQRFESQFPRVVFGAKDPKAGACGSVFDFTNEPKLNHRVEVRGGILEQDSQAIIQTFFRGLREASDVNKQLPPQ